MHARLRSPTWDELVDEVELGSPSSRADTRHERPTTEVWPPEGGDPDEGEPLVIVAPLSAVPWD